VTVKDRLHQLVDELPEGEIADAAFLILDELNRYGANPLARKLLSAPIDDEPEPDEERQLVEEARQDLAAGRVVSHEEIRREFGSS
jgi:hypothetical protein